VTDMDPVALLEEEMFAAGLRLEWFDGRLAFAGPAGLVTAGMRAVLDAFRDELVLQFPPPAGLRQWLWATGHEGTEESWWAWAPDYHPAGAWWWRFLGETRWQAVPGRGGVNKDTAA
jgi:hypothetical protein